MVIINKNRPNIKSLDQTTVFLTLSWTPWKVLLWEAVYEMFNIVLPPFPIRGCASKAIVGIVAVVNGVLERSLARPYDWFARDWSTFKLTTYLARLAHRKKYWNMTKNPLSWIRRLLVSKGAAIFQVWNIPRHPFDHSSRWVWKLMQIKKIRLF